MVKNASHRLTTVRKHVLTERQSEAKPQIFNLSARGGSIFNWVPALPGWVNDIAAQLISLHHFTVDLIGLQIMFLARLEGVPLSKAYKSYVVEGGRPITQSKNFICKTI